MFKKNCVDLIYRVICLATFVFVILFSKSIITLSALTVFFFFITKNDNDFLFIFFYLLSMLFFAVAYFVDNYVLLRIIAIIEYTYYFLNLPRVDKVINDKVNLYLDKCLNIQEEKKDEKKGEAVVKENNESEIDYIRFKSSRKTKKAEKKSDLIPTLYLAFHFFILLVSIAIG